MIRAWLGWLRAAPVILGLGLITARARVRGRARGILAVAACLVILFAAAWLIGLGQGEH